jgi:hypothetical protein
MSEFQVSYHPDSIDPPRGRQLVSELPPGTCLCPSCRAKERGKTRISLAKPGRPERGWRLD